MPKDGKRKTGSIKDQNVQVYVTPELKAWYQKEADKHGWKTSYLAGLVLEDYAANNDTSITMQVTPELKQWCEQHVQEANYRNISDLVNHALLNFASQNGFEPSVKPEARQEALLLTRLERAQAVIAEAMNKLKKSFAYLSHATLGLLIIPILWISMPVMMTSSATMVAQAPEDAIIITPTLPIPPQEPEEPRTA